MSDTRKHVDRRELVELDQAGLRALILQDLAWLDRLVPELDRLVDTHQRGIGFLTVEGRVALDRQVVKEREARLPNLKAGVVITGDVEAPVNITAVSLAGEIPLVLLDITRRIRRKITTAGVCYIHRLPDRPTFDDIHTDLTRLVPLIRSQPLLLETARTVTDLAERTWNLVRGNDRTEHPKPCPHCGRHTLVVYLDSGVIRCERDPHTGEHEPCICDDSYCDCKVRQHRHEWLRSTPPSKKWSWRTLARDQARVEREQTNQDHQEHR